MKVRASEQVSAAERLSEARTGEQAIEQAVQAKKKAVRANERADELMAQYFRRLIL